MINNKQKYSFIIVRMNLHLNFLLTKSHHIVNIN